eukprot:1818840-Amphidinium_carterae.1
MGHVRAHSQPQRLGLWPVEFAQPWRGGPTLWNQGAMLKVRGMCAERCALVWCQRNRVRECQ